MQTHSSGSSNGSRRQKPKSLTLSQLQKTFGSKRPLAERAKVNVYMVFWKDAWQTVEPDLEHTGLAPVVDIGFLAALNGERLVLGRQLFEDGYFRDVISIPNSCIEDIKLIGKLDLPKGFTGRINVI